MYVDDSSLNQLTESLSLPDLGVDPLLHGRTQPGDLPPVGHARVRRDELGEELGVLVVDGDGLLVPPGAEDAHGGLLAVRVLAEGRLRQRLVLLANLPHPGLWAEKEQFEGRLFIFEGSIGTLKRKKIDRKKTREN